MCIRDRPEPAAEPEYRGPYWTRPLAWDAQGGLIYMSTLCASDLVQDYQIYHWQGPKRSDLVGTGQSVGSFGAATLVGDGLAYIVTGAPQPGPRGPLASAPRSPASLWVWDLVGGARGRILDTERGIAAIGS